MVKDHRDARTSRTLLLILWWGLATTGCQSVVDPGRTMRPVPQGSTVVPPSGPALPSNSIPQDSSGVERQPAGAVLNLPQANSSESKYHTVQKGESWSGIAAKYKLTVSQLTQANGMETSTVLQPGQMIYIPEE